MKFLLRTGLAVVPLLHKLRADHRDFKKYIADINKGLLQEELFRPLLQVDKETIKDFTNKESGLAKIQELVGVAFDILERKLEGKQVKQTKEFAEVDILARLKNLNRGVVDLDSCNTVVATIVTTPLSGTQSIGNHLLDDQLIPTMIHTYPSSVSIRVDPSGSCPRGLPSDPA